MLGAVTGASVWNSWAAIELKSFTATTQPDGSILVRWVTGVELDTAIFRIYRALAITGPWDTVVDQQDSRSNGLSDTEYEYNDTDVAVGTTYFYLLEEVEVESSGGVNQYRDFIRQATAGQPGAATSTPTGTKTPTATATPTASPRPGVTSSPTPTWTVTPEETSVPTDTPTATRQNPGTPQATESPVPTQAVGTQPGAPAVTAQAGTRPTDPTGQATNTPASARQPATGTPPTGKIATATPSKTPAPTLTPNIGRLPTATLSPVVFLPKATTLPVLRSTPAQTSESPNDEVQVGRGYGWILALGGGAVVLAAFLGGLVFVLWRRRRS
jgi:hypothetical protein